MEHRLDEYLRHQDELANDQEPHPGDVLKICIECKHTEYSNPDHNVSCWRCLATGHTYRMVAQGSQGGFDYVRKCWKQHPWKEVRERMMARIDDAEQKLASYQAG